MNIDLFIAHFHNDKLSVGTVKSYLPDIRHRQISPNLGEPRISQIPQLAYMLKGMKRKTAENARSRKQITPQIQRKLRQVYSRGHPVDMIQQFWGRGMGVHWIPWVSALR